MSNPVTRPSFRVIVAGDLCPTRRVEEVFLSGGYEPSWFFSSFTDLFHSADFRIVNLECPLTKRGAEIAKVGPCLRAHPKTLELLEYLDVDLVTLANNHIRDYGDHGVADTIHHCATSGIATVGAGQSRDAARNIYSCELVPGHSLAVINVAENEFANATKDRAGANPLCVMKIVEDIRQAQRRANSILLILHGGIEHTRWPSPKSVETLRFLADQGLTAVIRHHPHHIQGYEVWNGVPIFYSLGNFLFDSKNSSLSGWFEGVALELNIEPNGSCDFQLHPFHQCRDKPRLEDLSDSERETFVKEMEENCSVLHDPELHQRKWQEFIAGRREAYLRQLALPFPNSLVMRICRRLKLLGWVRPTEYKRLLIQNLARCEAHREVLLDLLERES